MDRFAVLRPLTVSKKAFALVAKFDRPSPIVSRSLLPKPRKPLLATSESILMLLKVSNSDLIGVKSVLPPRLVKKDAMCIATSGSLLATLVSAVEVSPVNQPTMPPSLGIASMLASVSNRAERLAKPFSGIVEIVVSAEIRPSLESV